MKKNNRIYGLVALLMALTLVFILQLYQLQVVDGADYLAQTTRKISEIETVEAARGQILDRYGRVLVTNRLSYQVTLATSRMGSDAERNETLLRLTELCQIEGVDWTDNLPVSESEPFTYTTESASEAAQLRFERFLENRSAAKESYKTELTGISADALIDWFAAYYNISDTYSRAEIRRIAGILYELELRSRDLTTVAYVFAQDVPQDFIARVKEEGLSGVTIQGSTSRVYNTEYAAHLLGRVGPIDSDDIDYYTERGYAQNATVGKSGVELAFESYLKGSSGTRAIERNEAGKIVSETYITEPDPGGNVFLTIDIKLQEATEKAIANHIDDFNEAQGAAAVILDVNDGSVLAMASYPTYNLATFNADYEELASDPLEPFNNRATRGLYAPGSTYKMVVATAALETGLIDAKTEILCTGRYIYYDDYQPMCWIYRQYGRTHGRENVTSALTDSCNIFFYDVGRRLGIDTIAEYATLYGLGQPTGIEISESVGVVASQTYTESRGQTWNPGNVLSASVGQLDNSFTPLQLANYCATIANGGSHNSVHLLQSVKSSDFQSIVYQREAELLNEFTISETAMKAIHEGMYGVANGSGSTARYFANLGVEVAAKTGTAQIAADKDANAVFLAFAPYENPEIAICLVVEQGGSGTEAAAIVADIFSYYFSNAEATDAPQGENQLLR